MVHIKRGRSVTAIAATALVGLSLAACGSGDSGGAGAEDTGPPSGALLVLTNRTDVVNTVFKGYVKEFNKKYPDVTVKFEALTDYPGEVKTRMSTKDYGDVLLVPNEVTTKDLPDFFEPLGTTEELGKKYRFINAKAADGKVYGLATFGNASGMVYNKKVFADAGVTEWPKTPEELISDLQAVKAKTKATPYYTNYKDGWPLSWPASMMGSVSGDADASVKMAKDDSPWAEGKELNTLSTLLDTMVKDGLSEKDPTTTNWENSKNLIATGKVAFMPLGSWALPQMQQAAKDAGANPDDIGFMPAPYQKDGKWNSPIGPDWTQGINVNSENKKAARAWIDFFTNDSGFYKFAGGVPTPKELPMPKDLQAFADKGVNFIDMTPSPELSAVDNESEIGISQPDAYREIVDSARGASKTTLQQLFDKWNTKWAAAIKTVG